jgi:hypothetical protein
MAGLRDQLTSTKIITAPDPTWSAVQLWAYALGAPYHVQHGVPVDSIRIDSASRMEMAKMCRRDWEIESADKLIETLNWLASSGHRTQYRYRIRQYSLMRRPAIAARREELREAQAENPDALQELWRLDAVQSDWQGIRGGVLLGFDAARAVMLVRCGLILGWLTEDAAWAYLTALAADVQRSFGSWAAYAADYKLSHALWTGHAKPGQFDLITDQLLTAKNSPWRKLPWEIAGLEVPRRVTPIVPGAPLWSLER